MLPKALPRNLPKLESIKTAEKKKEKVESKNEDLYSTINENQTINDNQADERGTTS